MGRRQLRGAATGLTGTGLVCTVTGVTHASTEAAAERPARRLRKERGLTQEQLAAKVGCSQATVFDIESGRAQPSLKLALAIAEALDSTVDDLFSGAA